MPEFATAAAALQRGEVDWLEVPSPDLLPMLRRDPNLTVGVKDKTGVVPIMRFNCIQPPFDNHALRQAVVSAVDQAEFMRAVSNDPANWRRSCRRVLPRHAHGLRRRRAGQGHRPGGRAPRDRGPRATRASAWC